MLQVHVPPMNAILEKLGFGAVGTGVASTFGVAANAVPLENMSAAANKNAA